MIGFSKTKTSNNFTFGCEKILKKKNQNEILFINLALKHDFIFNVQKHKISSKFQVAEQVCYNTAKLLNINICMHTLSLCIKFMYLINFLWMPIVIEQYFCVFFYYSLLFHLNDLKCSLTNK